MFSGSVRHNLDPFDNHGDAELWEVLQAVGLKPLISAMDAKLEAPVVDNGGNFSQVRPTGLCRWPLPSAALALVGAAAAPSMRRGACARRSQQQQQARSVPCPHPPPVHLPRTA
jgi:hypothetical protein